MWIFVGVRGASNDNMGWSKQAILVILVAVSSESLASIIIRLYEVFYRLSRNPKMLDLE